MTGIIAILAAAGFGAWETVQHSIEKATEEKVAAAVKEQVKISSDKLEEEIKSEQDALRRLREQAMDDTANFKVDAKQALAQIQSWQQEVEAKRDIVIKSLEVVNGEVTQLVQTRVTTSLSSNNVSSSVFGAVPEGMIAISSSGIDEASFEIIADGGGVFSTRFLKALRRLSAKSEEVALEDVFSLVSREVRAVTEEKKIPMHPYITSSIAPPTPILPPLSPPGKNSHGVFRAVLVGIQSYHDSELAQLCCSGRDVSDLANSLEQKSFRVTKLIDVAQNEIRRALDELRKDSHKEDTVLFYFSGIVGNVPSDDGSKPSKYKALVTIDSTNNSSNWLSGPDLVQAIESIPARHRIIIVDG